MSQINWFAAISVPVYVGAGIDSLYLGNYRWMGVWWCWAIANALLISLEARGQ